MNRFKDTHITSVHEDPSQITHRHTYNDGSGGIRH